MLCRHTMPRPDNTPLQERECRLYGIRVDVAIDVAMIFVANLFVLLAVQSSFVNRPRINAKFVSHHHVNVTADIFLDVLRQRPDLHVLSVEEAKIAATLLDANDYFFGSLASVDAPAALLSAHIGFVYFDGAIQLRKGLYSSHRMADSVTEIPCSTVVDSQHTFKLICRHPFERLAHQISSEEPFNHRQVR